MYALAELDGGELYVAPLYNHLIAAGQDIRFTEIAPDEVIFCGIPAEYEAFLAREVQGRNRPDGRSRV